MRFRDARLTVAKNAIYPPGHEPPEIVWDDSVPRPTHRVLSRRVGHSAVKRKRFLPLDFPEPKPNRAAMRKEYGMRRPRRRLQPLTKIDLPWSKKDEQSLTTKSSEAIMETS